MLKPYGQGHRSLWDVIGERREQEERLVAPARAPADYDLARMALDNAWLWLPNLEPARAATGKMTEWTDADFDHDPRLISAAGHRRNVRRIRWPTKALEVQPLPRALQLLEGMLSQWSEFASSIDWESTKVILFAPTDIASDPWLAEVLAMWPFDYLPGEGFDSTSRAFDDWLPWALQNQLDASGLLCISIDTWATQSRAATLTGELMAGESVAVLNLRRVDHANPEDGNGWYLFPSMKCDHAPRALQPRASSDDLRQLAESLFEQAGARPEDIKACVTDGHHHDKRLEHLSHYLSMQLPHCDMQEHVVGQALLAGERGTSAHHMTALGLAFHVGNTNGGAVLVFERRAATQTQAWLLSSRQKALSLEPEQVDQFAVDLG
ncbi:hypothetical protein NRB15_23555 [Pseudomonas alliivorans]|uniref:hypothetical protein n=1 Tax=Pseudomonas alliivorans TaxID=2810613 RepID=UPI00211CAC0C|nr:hypothetical protein [Pseudomonas alliivorans]MCQ9473322.1 hypothetical protein [Pseudomonas alliivorans]